MYRNQTGSPSAASRQGWKPSASVVTGATGTVVGEQRYYPFGETRGATGSMFTDKLFTGQREMAGLGIYHYGARFYSPKLGRFLSADTIVPDPYNPQAFNRYSYVLNNPLRYTDPTGHKCVPVDECETPHGDKIVKPDVISHIPKPEGLSEDGTDAYNGLMTLLSMMDTWWNADHTFTVQEALAMLLWREAGVTVGYSYDNEGNQAFSYPEPVVTAIIAKWQQYCTNGWDSVDCLNKFWGYYQAILDVSTDIDLQQEYITHNLHDGQSTYGGDVNMRTAATIMNAPPISITYTTPIGWATVQKGSTVWDALDIGVSYIYTYPDKNSKFFVVSAQQQDAICEHLKQLPGCNLSMLE